MYSKTRLSLKWLRYFILASNSRGHGIHSPFVYELVSSVFNDDRNFYAYKKIEEVKSTLLLDNRLLEVEDAGAGVAHGRHSLRKVSSIASRSLSTKKFGRLLFRLAGFYQARQIIELGSSLGISAGYLALADENSKVVTLEGSRQIAGVAIETYHSLGLKNVCQIIGSFEETLEKVFQTDPPADLVFLDGNHRKKPVLENFELILQNIKPASLIIIHDIHWSREMEEAWEIICKLPAVKMTVDIFSAGLVFFREEFQVKQNFTIRF